MRECRRCHTSQAHNQYAPYGEICLTCKRAALARRDARNRTGGKVGTPRKYATAEEARAAKRKMDAAYVRIPRKSIVVPW